MVKLLLIPSLDDENSSDAKLTSIGSERPSLSSLDGSDTLSAVRHYVQVHRLSTSSAT